MPRFTLFGQFAEPSAPSRAAAAAAAAEGAAVQVQLAASLAMRDAVRDESLTQAALRAISIAEFAAADASAAAGDASDPKAWEARAAGDAALSAARFAQTQLGQPLLLASIDPSRPALSAPPTPEAVLAAGRLKAARIAKAAASELEEDIVANIDGILNTKEGYGYFIPHFGLGSYDAYRGTREASDVLREEIEREVAINEPRFKSPQVTLLGRDGNLRIQFELNGSIEGAARTYLLLFDTVTGNVRVDPWIMPSSFRDRLTLDLTLTIAGTAHTIPAGDIKGFDLSLHSWGFEASLDFFIADDKSYGGGEKDELLADFIKPDLMEADLKVQAVYTDYHEIESPFQTIELKGLVRNKSVSEHQYGPPLTDRVILYRHYFVSFVDPAQLLWGQHFPSNLYTNKKPQDVFDDNKGDKITLTYDWSGTIDTQLPMIFLGLNPDREDGGARAASFYDFAIWFVDTRNGVFTYDYATQGYKLTGVKDASATPVQVRGLDIAELRTEFPELPRYQPYVLNSYTEGATNQSIANAQTATGMRQDHLLRTPIADQATARVTAETTHLKLRGLEVRLAFNRFPAEPVMPGSLVDFVSDKQFSPDGLAVTNKSFRVYDLQIKGRAIDASPDADHRATSSSYLMELTATAELKGEEHVKLPAYRTPVWPRHVEGKIVSEVGEDTDETYQFYTDDQTNQDSYKVKIPLWANQIVTMPYDPNFHPGHFYFAAYKNERVVVAMEFLSAWLARFVDWRAGALLPAEGQGDNLMMGKTTKNNTSMSHFYQDDKPVFLVLRTNDKDTGTIQIQEGNMLMKIKEND